MSEEKAKEEKKEEVKVVRVTLNGKGRYYDNWHSLFITYASPEVVSYLSTLEKYGIEKFKVIEFLLESLLDKDPVEVAKKVNEWDLMNVIAWKEAQDKGAK
jgi:hypothetical protein